jgi:hypothetical protein
MSDITRAIEHVERVMTRALDKPLSGTAPRQTHEAKAPKVYAWRAPASDNSQYAAQTVFKDKEKPIVTKLLVSARAVKVTIPLDPAVVGALPVPDGARADLAVNCDGKLYSASIATKSLRKAKTTIGVNGADATFVMLQGRLKGDEIIECGLVAQVKAAKVRDEERQ